MTPDRVPALQTYLAARSGGGVADAEERAKIENFLWDERPQAAVTKYATALRDEPVADLDDWQGRHSGFLETEIFVSRGAPELPLTFQQINDINRLRAIDPNLYLVRVEMAAWPCKLVDRSFPDLEKAVSGNMSGELAGFAESWNAGRDRRPMFATTYLEVEDILDSDAPDWAERLRDRLGLGYLDPGVSGAPVEIVVMRYTVGEVLDSVKGGKGHPAVPTLLDGTLNPHFFPTPFPSNDGEPGADWRGHTLNLTPGVNANNYRMGVELLHPAIDYLPEHFFRTGIIAQPVGIPLDVARSFHLPWLQLNYGRDDFGVASSGEHA